MASQAWLDSSLRRSASLGLEVLERASRRTLDWTSTGASQTSSATDEDAEITVKKAHRELDDVFGTVADLMAQMTHQCKRFYASGCCIEPTDTERNHVSRFHSRLAAGMRRPALSTRKHARARCRKGRVSAADEDFFIEVSPGTYAVTATMPDSQQQTQLVSVKAGESINVTFNV